MSKTLPVAVFDVEIFWNYFLVALKRLDTGKVAKFEIRPGVDLDRKRLEATMRAYTIVSFNGNDFDLPIIAYALQGATTIQLKTLCNDIIANRLKYFISARKYGFELLQGLDHIDIMETAPGVKTGLKTYQGRVHGRRMQDLPFHENEELQAWQMDEVADYCVNDLEATENLFNALKEPIALREVIGKQYGGDYRSKSDAQVAEALIKSEIERITGKAPTKAPRIGGLKFKYQVPDYIEFDNPDLNHVVDRLRLHEFVTSSEGNVQNPDFLHTSHIKIGDAHYNMGIGGLHSCEKLQVVRPDEDEYLIDSDVVSYYPYMIIMQKLFPEHLGEAFLTAFTAIVTRRVEAKAKAGALKKALKKLTKGTAEYLKTEAEMISFKNVADSLKIAINGIFGKFGSMFSVVFAPNLMIQTTISGQLNLLLFVEMLTRAGITVVSGNTDGVAIRIKKDRKWVLDLITHEWEEITKLEMEQAFYAVLLSRDVNNYIAIKPDGSTKGKGAFANPMYENDTRGMLQKNPESIICLEAAVARIYKGTPVGDTIRKCKDIRKFISIRSVTGGALYGDEYLGKVVRWYHGHTSLGCIVTKKKGDKVANSDGAVPLMEMNGEIPHDLNYDYYELESLAILEQLGYSVPITPKNAFVTFFRKYMCELRA